MLCWRTDVSLITESSACCFASAADFFFYCPFTFQNYSRLVVKDLELIDCLISK